MPSQEDYLDNLLRDVAEDNEIQEDVSDQDILNQDIPDQDILGQDTPDQDILGQDTLDHDIFDQDASDQSVPGLDAEAPDLDAVSGMSEEEIDKLLSAGSAQEDTDFYNTSDMDIPDEDVLKMLEDSDDEGLQDIQELLQKSDNNEAVDESVTALLEDYPEEDIDSRALEEKILGSDKEIDGKEEKKRQAREKKELARAEKERKKEEAAARKAEKKAARAGQKAAKPKKSKGGKQAAVPEEAGTEEAVDSDMFDPSVLDSIVSAADRAGGKPEQMTDELAEVFPEPESNEEPLQGTPGLDDLDLGSLFGGDADDSDVAKSIGEADSDFPDFLAGDGIDLADLEDADILREKEKEGPKQKQGFFAKIMNFLTEEEEENEDIKLSQENQDILNDLDKEGKGAKGKKGKKGKGKGKEEDKEKESKKIKEKPKKKEPKPKKEKPPKEPDNTPPGKKLTLKKMLPVLLVGLSVGVLLFVFVNSAVDYSDKKIARTAYYEGDYQTCYQNLFGKDLNETESIMYGKSESILYIRLWTREYELFMGEGDRVRALDSLIQTVDAYPELYAYAGQWNAEPEIAAGYATILNYLANEFGLTEAQAQAIAAERSDREYTRMVTAIAGGRSFDNWNAPAVPEEPDTEPELPAGEEEQMPDPLPEEGELGGDTFIDNQ